MKKNLFYTLFYIFIIPFAHSATRLFTENDLVAWSKINAPGLEEIKTGLLASENQKNILYEQYAPEIFAKGSYAETQERPIIEFLPVFSPIKQAQLGVRKKFTHGLETQILATTDQRSASSAVSGKYNNVTTTVFSFTLQMDLWRDLFGRVSEAQRQNADVEARRAEFEKEIKTRAFEIALRRIYWSLVAVNEQIKLAEALKVTASHQVVDAKKRLRNSIGDAGEVARYEAQVAARTSQAIFFSYQRENYLKQLKNLLPDLLTDDMQLAPYDVEKTISKVVECSGLIARESAVPYGFTKYDEVLSLLREIKGNQKVINDRYSDVDVKFFGTVKSTGIGSDKKADAYYSGSYGGAFDDMNNNNRTGFETGVNLIIPLGDAKETTQKTKTLYDEKLLKSQMYQTHALVVSTHTQLAKSMGLINEVIASQRIGTTALEKRLQVIRQKYSQARVSVNDLILDQDALLNSQLTTIDAQLQAVNILFDYLMVFTDTPCAFNRI
jgi:outer membrane protein TolC